MWDFDAVSFYPSAMWDEKTIYPRIETGHTYTKDMDNEIVHNFIFGNFTEESVILKTKFYNPKNLFVHYVPVKERENEIENKHMRNGFIIDTLTSVDVQEIVKIGGKVKEIYEGVIYREKFKVSPFGKVIDKICFKTEM